MRRLLLSVFMTMPFCVSAQTISPSSLQVVGDFFKNMSDPGLTANQCTDDPQPCIQYCSERASAYDKASVLDFVKACRGNVGSGCAAYVSERISSYDKANLIDIAVACRGNINQLCVKYASERTSSYDKATVLEYARACHAFLQIF